MKITRLETLCLSRMHEPERQWFTGHSRTIKADCAIVVIHTDEGQTGIGEASAYGWPRLIRSPTKLTWSFSIQPSNLVFTDTMRVSS